MEMLPTQCLLPEGSGLINIQLYTLRLILINHPCGHDLVHGAWFYPVQKAASHPCIFL